MTIKWSVFYNFFVLYNPLVVWSIPMNPKHSLIKGTALYVQRPPLKADAELSWTRGQTFGLHLYFAVKALACTGSLSLCCCTM